MKLTTVATILAVASTVAAKKYLISFPDDTPQQEVDDAANKLESKGAKITHQYTLIKGFALDAPEEVIQNYEVSVQDATYKPAVEEDQVLDATASTAPTTQPSAIANGGIVEFSTTTSEDKAAEVTEGSAVEETETPGSGASARIVGGGIVFALAGLTAFLGQVV